MANDLSNSLKVAKATYNFATVGGAVSTITLPGSDIIPSGAIIQDVVIDCTTACTTSAGATIAVTGGGLTLAGSTPIAVAAAPFTGGTVGRVGAAGVITTGYVVQKATSSAAMQVVIGTGAVTAGAFTVYVYYTV